MELILASGNSHKVEEFGGLLKNLHFQIKQAPEKLDVIEDGETFRDNSLIKAKAYFDKFSTPSLSDDSGLVIPSRPDLLGVYSARFAPECATYLDKCKKLLDEFKGLNLADRKAYFVSYLCFYLSPEEIFFFEGRVHGHISNEILGDDGFGYDPIFVPEGNKLSFAQDPDWKALHSHRAKAVQSAIKFFSSHK